jgi:hypothetical protein
VRRALSVCQDGFRRVTQVFFRKLLSREELTELGNLGNERGGEWLPWANGTKEVIWDCRLLLEDVSRSIGHCWQEAAEHAGATSVSVRTTNIGQKIISTSSATELGFERAHDRRPRGRLVIWAELVAGRINEVMLRALTIAENCF